MLEGTFYLAVAFPVAAACPVQTLLSGSAAILCWHVVVVGVIIVLAGDSYALEYWELNWLALFQE